MFAYADAVLERFPTIRAGVVHAAGLVNRETAPALTNDFLAEQGAARRRLEDRPIAETPSIAAWRRAFSAFGVKPTQYRNAAEALLRRLAKNRDIPSISLLVDLGNLVSIRYALPVALFDQSSVVGSTAVRFADGSEQFVDLGSNEVVHPEPGEVVFVDDAGVVSARRWCWAPERGKRHRTRDGRCPRHGGRPSRYRAARREARARRHRRATRYPSAAGKDHLRRVVAGRSRVRPRIGLTGRPPAAGDPISDRCARAKPARRYYWRMSWMVAVQRSSTPSSTCT